MEKLWTSQEVATFLKVDETVIEKLILEGRITGYRVGGKFLRFRPAEIEVLKGRVALDPQEVPVAPKSGGNFADGLADFFYFNDFYMIAAGLLAGMAVYLVMA